MNVTVVSYNLKLEFSMCKFENFASHDGNARPGSENTVQQTPC